MTVSKIATEKNYSWQSSKHFGQIARKPIDIIVLHHNASTTAGNAPAAWLTREASAHYQVEPNRVVSCLDEDITAWHCGAKGADNNSHTIGIEHLNSTGAPNWLVAEATQENSAQLVAEICTRRNISIDRQHIVKHQEMPNCQTDCPGGLDIDWIVKRAKEIAGGVTPVQPTKENSKMIYTFSAAGQTGSFLFDGQNTHAFAGKNAKAAYDHYTGTYKSIMGKSIPTQKKTKEQFALWVQLYPVKYVQFK